MELWDKVCTTDADNTKAVSYGQRKFTAIDAYSQIRAATEVFGPMGIGWWYEFDVIENDAGVFADLKLYYVQDDPDDPQPEVSKPIRVIGGTHTKDTDSYKKAVTDALTKALSYLGFNADVFLGAFDDNKYTNQSEGPSQPRQSPQTKSEGGDKGGQGKPPAWREARPARWDMTCCVCAGQIEEGSPCEWNGETGGLAMNKHPGCIPGGPQTPEEVRQMVQETFGGADGDGDDIPFEQKPPAGRRGQARVTDTIAKAGKIDKW
jgi:hypothetical protein